MQSMIDFFASRDWSAIIDGIIQWGAIAILSTLCIIFRKNIGNLARILRNQLRIAIKRARRLRYKQILPAHTLEHLRLRRKLRAAEKELTALKQKNSEQDEELEKAIDKLLHWAALNCPFTNDQLLRAMPWNTAYSDLIFGLAFREGFIRRPETYVHGDTILYYITTAGQERVFRAGLLKAN